MLRLSQDDRTGGASPACVWPQRPPTPPRRPLAVRTPPPLTRCGRSQAWTDARFDAVSDERRRELFEAYRAIVAEEAAEVAAQARSPAASSGGGTKGEGGTPPAVAERERLAARLAELDAALERTDQVPSPAVLKPDQLPSVLPVPLLPAPGSPAAAAGFYRYATSTPPRSSAVLCAEFRPKLRLLQPRLVTTSFNVALRCSSSPVPRPPISPVRCVRAPALEGCGAARCRRPHRTTV